MPWWHGIRLIQFAVKLVGGDSWIVRDPADVETLRRELEHIATKDYVGERRVPQADFEANLRGLAQLASRHGARFALLVEPMPAKTVERNPIALVYAELVRKVARVDGHPVVDGWAEFEKSGLSDDELFVDFAHPSERGHALLAAAMERVLRD